MSTHKGQLTLLDRFRRASPLRVLFIVTALLASQGSMACAIEGAFASQEAELSFDAVDAAQKVVAIASAEDSGEDCCGLCVDCINCGACCSFAVVVRLNASRLSLAAISDANVSFATAAPTLWTPPTLLRPPITAA